MLFSSAAPGQDGPAASPLTTACLSLQDLLEAAQALQADLEPLLQASKLLIGQLEPGAAALVQSESRLLSRGVQQLSRELAGKLGQLQV